MNLSRVDLRVLSVFVDVVEHEGFSAAASAKGASLSTVTRDVAALETRLGVRLCQRGRGGFALTQQGEEVYRAAQELMAGLRGFETRISGIRRTLPDKLGIGLIHHMLMTPNSDFHLIETLTELRQQRPDIHFQIDVHAVPAIDVLVRERRIDIGFTANPEYLTPLSYVHAFDERHGLFVSRACPHYDAIVRREEGCTRPIGYVKRSFPSKHFEAFEAAMPFEVTAVGNSLESVLAAVRAGAGVGVLPLHAAAQFEELERLPFPEKGLFVPFFIAFRKDAAQQPAVASFLKYYSMHARHTGTGQQV